MTTRPSTETNHYGSFFQDYTMSKDSKTTLKGRDAGSGQFIPVEQARRNPSTSVVERVPKPGRGDTGSGKKK